MKTERFKYLRTRIIRLWRHPHNIRYCFNKNIKDNGIVILTHESEMSGAPMLALHIAKDISNRGIPVYVISKFCGVLNDEYAKAGNVKVVWNKYQFEHTLARLKKHGYQHLILNTTVNGDYAEAAKKYNFKVAALIHELPELIKNFRIEKDLKAIDRYADIIIFPSNYVLEKNEKVFHLASHEKYVIKPQGIYHTVPESEVLKKRIAEIKKRTGFSNDKKYIFGAGASCKRKGFDRFLKLAKSCEKYDWIHLWWAGPAGKQQVLLETGEYKNITYLGLLSNDEMAAVYNLTDIMVIASREDPFPSAALEAMAYGNAVFGFEGTGGIADIIENGQNGMLAEDGNVTMLAGQIVSCLKDKSYIEMGRRARDTVREYDFHKYVSYLLSCFSQ